MLIRPTDDSGLAWVLAENIRLTASDWAENREGLYAPDQLLPLLKATKYSHVVAIPAALAIVDADSRLVGRT